MFSLLGGIALAADTAPGSEPGEDETLIADASTAAVIEPAAAPPGGREKSKPKKFEFTLLDRESVNIKYSRKGLEIKSRSGNYTARVRVRSQLRYSYPYDSDPRKDSHFGAVKTNDIYFRRARLKADGVAFGKWFKYNFEYDLVDPRVLNLYATAKVKDWLQFRGGQWKADFSRERVTSSAKQQFVERSAVNRDFTVDRQAGFGILGHLMPGTRGDSWYYVNVLTGTGRGNGFDDDSQPMIVGRYQWNFLGQDMGFSSSDLEYHDEPAASFAVAGVTNRSRYTRFSSGGGSQLDGFEAGEAGQYSLKQAMGEFFFKYRGLSIQNENHWKNIYDNINLDSTDMAGSYAQAGYFPHNLLPIVPKKLEVGYRYGFVDPNTAIPSEFRQEHTVLVNYFFEGHSNKLSFDVGRVSLDRADMPNLSVWRYRVQWDVHF